jgi:hypothetical protein
MNKVLWILSAALTTTSLTASSARAESVPTLEINPQRSLIVTELSALQNFGLKRTMDQLASQTGVPGLTGEKLFRQWFDIMNPLSEARTTGPRCDDQIDLLTGIGLLNSYPFTCRPASKNSEGLEAALPTDPMAGYVPITLTNRFDLAPGNGAHCGEYRIVYARNSGLLDDRNRNFLIFEAALPNPDPTLGLKGCKEVVKLWTSLTKVTSAKKRGEILESFYYKGYLNFIPVIHARNFGANSLGAGQFRTNQFMQPRDQFASGVWTMREYKLDFVAATSAVIRPVTVKTNPFGPLFQSEGAHPRRAEFQDYFITQVAGLAVPNFSFNYSTPDQFNTGQSQANGAENNYVTQLGGDTSVFGQRIQAELTRIGSPLTPTNVVARAQSLSCAGCHRLNANPEFAIERRDLGGGLVMPVSLDFTQTGERSKEIVNGEEAWAVSPAMKTVFLPARKQLVFDYLVDKLKNPRNPTDPIGGKSHH